MRARARRKEFFFLFLWTNNISIQVSIFFWRWGFDIATIIKNSLFLTFSVVPRFEFSSITIKYNLVDYRDLGAVNWTAASSLRVYRILTYLCAVFNPFAFCNENNERKSERAREPRLSRETQGKKKRERRETTDVDVGVLVVVVVHNRQFLYVYERVQYSHSVYRAMSVAIKTSPLGKFFLFYLIYVSIVILF